MSRIPLLRRPASWRDSRPPVTDIDPTDPRCNLNARYVAASRARHRLYVFAKGDWLSGASG